MPVSVETFLKAIEDTGLAGQIRESGLLFPLIETAHVMAITLVIGSIAVVDLRLLGVTSKRKPVTELTREVLPWTWGVFAIAVASGGLMFISKASAYFVNWPFRLKMLCLLLAGINMAIFHLFTYRSVRVWDQDRPTLLGAKVAGLLSLMFWIGVVTFGRWIGFTVR
jgi:hypothetical protein